MSFRLFDLVDAENAPKALVTVTSENGGVHIETPPGGSLITREQAENLIRYLLCIKYDPHAALQG